ncbi:MAG: hypothetical protein AAGF50_05680 [Pseudomonadota bacterium]
MASFGNGQNSSPQHLLRVTQKDLVILVPFNRDEEDGAAALTEGKKQWQRAVSLLTCVLFSVEGSAVPQSEPVSYAIEDWSVFEG